MATFTYNGVADLVFPTLRDADGNVLVVKTGDTFEGPDDLVADGVSAATANIGKGKSNVTPAPAPSDAVSDAKTPDTSAS